MARFIKRALVFDNGTKALSSMKGIDSSIHLVDALESVGDEMIHLYSS